jgi:hypothetical protein
VIAMKRNLSDTEKKEEKKDLVHDGILLVTAVSLFVFFYFLPT